MSLMSQPARGGSKMTVWSGAIYSRASSDLAKTGIPNVSQFLASS